MRAHIEMHVYEHKIAVEVARERLLSIMRSYDRHELSSEIFLGNNTTVSFDKRGDKGHLGYVRIFFLPSEDDLMPQTLTTLVLTVKRAFGTGVEVQTVAIHSLFPPA